MFKYIVLSNVRFHYFVCANDTKVVQSIFIYLSCFYIGFLKIMIMLNVGTVRDRKENPLAFVSCKKVLLIYFLIGTFLLLDCECLSNIHNFIKFHLFYILILCYYFISEMIWLCYMLNYYMNYPNSTANCVSHNIKHSLIFI